MQDDYRNAAARKPGRTAFMLVVCAGLVAGAMGAQAQAQAQSGTAERCRDYGSFGVVDGVPPPRRGEPIVAQPFQPCADLPGQAQPQIYIDAQVQVGGGWNNGGVGNGSGSGSGSGGGVVIGPGAGQPIARPPQPYPVWRDHGRPGPFVPITPR